MRVAYYILIASIGLLASCSGGDKMPGQPPRETGVDIMLGQNRYATRVVDADNLESEQVINNISVFFTDPSSDAIVYKYVDAGFRTSGDYRIVNIPLERNVLQQKDIYVITNYDDMAALEALTSITGMEQLRTPLAGPNNNLEAGQGFCMYGMTPAFDFTDEGLGSPVVNVERTCAKIRINLSFPGNPRLSTDNSYLIAHAATYTFVMENTGGTLPSGAYFNFAAEKPLEVDGTRFSAIAYVYQASEQPVLYIYTHINGSAQAQEFTANLPHPDRNYLYDLDVRIYEDISPTRLATAGNYRMETVLTAYGSDGKTLFVDTL